MLALAPIRCGAGEAIVWMHDAEQLTGEKRVPRSTPWRPEWQRKAMSGTRKGPAGAGAGPTPLTATVPAEAGVDAPAPVDKPRLRSPSFRARLRAARPHHHA